MKRVLLLFGIISSLLSVSAEENVLQTIEIEPIKDTYNIVLVSDKAVDVKKTIQGSNKITLTMKDIRASKALNTIYNNVSNVDSVLVEPQGNGLKIFFQADNASAATVTFDALVASAPIAPVKSAKSLKLNNPIESYAPIYHEEVEAPKTSSLFKKLKSSSALTEIKETLDEDSVNDFGSKAISYGLIGLLAFAVIRLFKRKEPEMKIGLSQSLNEREINMYRGASPIAPSYTTATEKPFTTINYGLNAYQKENLNPYESEPITFHNQNLRNYTAQVKQDLPIQTLNRPVQTAPVTQPMQRKMTTPVNTAPVNQSNPNVDNLKFLESMTAIYEKSGRHDLARGLKASLNKNNTK